MPPKKGKQKKAREQKKGASSKEKAAQLKEAVKKGMLEAVWTDFPVSGSGLGLSVRAVIEENEKIAFRTLYAFDGDHRNLYRRYDKEGSEEADVRTVTHMYAYGYGGEKHDWPRGAEPDIPDFDRPKEEKKAVEPSELDGFGKDSPTVGGWRSEDADVSSLSAGPFRAATEDALEALRALEASVTDPPAGFIPVVIADPQTYGPDAHINPLHKAWYNTKSGNWMKPPAGGSKQWTVTAALQAGSPAALAVFRSLKGIPVRSSYVSFKSDNQRAEDVSLDDLEKLIPKVEQTPLTDPDRLLRLLQACSDGQLSSGDYVVGVQDTYAVFRLNGAATGQPSRVVPTIDGDTLHELPNGNYVAYRYTVPPLGLKDEAQQYNASVTNLILTIGAPVGGAVTIWPKGAARRQQLIDSGKPDRLDQVRCDDSQWREDWDVFCAHHGLSNASPDIVVFPMIAIAETGSLPWHVTVKKADLRSYFRDIDEPAEEGDPDPPPTIEDIWENLGEAHVTVEWYRGAWDNPANPRIFRKSGAWSFLARVGTDAGGGRPTTDPFTGALVPTTVTPDLSEQYKRFTKKHPPGAVIKQILTKNIEP